LFHEPAQGSFRERIIIQYARRGFTGFLNLPRSPGIPSITEAQAEALDALHFLAEKYSLTLDFQKGDIQFVNNLSIFHARDGFTDEPGKGWGFRTVAFNKIFSWLIKQEAPASALVEEPGFGMEDTSATPR